MFFVPLDHRGNVNEIFYIPEKFPFIFQLIVKITSSTFISAVLKVNEDGENEIQKVQLENLEWKGMLAGWEMKGCVERKVFEDLKDQ